MMVSNRLHIPLLLPTIAFVAGCLMFRNIDLWVSLVAFATCGAFFIWRGWSVALLAMMVTVGGVRVSMDSAHTHASVSETASTPASATKWEESWFIESNEWAQSRIDDLALSERAQRLMSSMILGNRNGFDWQTKYRYGVSGASHVLAVSGLHISIIVMLLSLLLRPIVLLGRGHIFINVVMIALIWIYAGVVGFSQSVVRSAVMFSVLQVAWASGVYYSGLNGLCVAVLGCAVVSPEILYSVGFQLSVVAVASIFLWGLPLYYRFFGGGGALVSAFCISFCCGVATMPIISYIFGYIPILGILFSPLFVLCTTVIVAVGIVWIIFVSGVWDAPLRLIIEAAAMILEGSVGWVAEKDWGSVEWRASDLQITLIYLIYIIITFIVWNKKSQSKGV